MWIYIINIVVYKNKNGRQRQVSVNLVYSRNGETVRFNQERVWWYIAQPWIIGNPSEGLVTWDLDRGVGRCDTGETKDAADELKAY